VTTFRTARFGLLRCAACGTFRIDPPPLEADEDAAAFYTSYYDTPDGRPPGQPTTGRRRSRFWAVAEAVPKLTEPGRVALDLGCGDGGLCAEWLASGWPRVVGVDASATRLERARCLVSGATFHPAPVEAVPEPPGSVDLVAMDNVIEHLPTPVATLRSVRPLLAPDGRIVVITPNMESGHFRLLGKRWTPELAPHTHVFLFTEASLRQSLLQAGFSVDHSGSFHLPFHPRRAWQDDWRSGRLRGVVWRAMQEAGGVYGRLRGAGPMIYAVGRVPSAG
jgi:2-polyprenyl-3-methyl-5-hydroxy-6-metoxy-1,4-benzoquinol methylase